jgi:hypothetical protein
MSVAQQQPLQYHHGSWQEQQVSTISSRFGTLLQSAHTNIQDSMRICIRRILSAFRSPSINAIYFRNEIGRADNKMWFGSWIQGGKTVWTRKERWSSQYISGCLVCERWHSVWQVRDEYRDDFDNGRGMAPLRRYSCHIESSLTETSLSQRRLGSRGRSSKEETWTGCSKHVCCRRWFG